jgi:hypothetical protein
MHRFRAQVVLLFATLMLAHAQCVLACAVDDCRQAVTPPCHRHAPARNCNPDHFVSAQAPAVKLAPCEVAVVPAPATAITMAASSPMEEPTRLPPKPVPVLLLTPLRV